jgi:hypothetical protein
LANGLDFGTSTITLQLQPTGFAETDAVGNALVVHRDWSVVTAPSSTDFSAVAAASSADFSQVTAASSSDFTEVSGEGSL